MNTVTKLIAAAAVLTTIVVPTIASAQLAIEYPPAASATRGETSNIPTDVRGSVHHGWRTPRPYGQW